MGSVCRPGRGEYPGHEECLAAIAAAARHARSAPLTPESIDQLGSGWVAEEALAIALFCSLVAESFEHGVTLAVNHGGNSGGTGALTGSILGALHGKQRIPTRWLEGVELRPQIETLAKDMFRHFRDPGGEWDEMADWAKYPGV